ncbi:MAG: ABC-2 family transporter protein [Chthonomonadales bacterium]|nr:ABC-2 family transporter protein [Chthonomonadales bacterium]
MRYLRLLLVFYRTSVQTDIEYRADFFTRIIASLLGLATTLGALSLAYQYTTLLKGWTFQDALVLIAVYYLMDGLIEMTVAPNMRQVMTQIRDGTLDYVVLKPVSAQFLASFRTLNIWRAANALVGVALCTHAVLRLSVSAGLAQALLFALTLACGLCVVYAVWLTLVTLTFWFVKIDNIEQIVWQAFEAGRYPIDIYPAWLRGALTYVIPISFIITVPAEALTGRLGASTAAVACIVAACALAAASAFWRYGLKHYTGASA